MQANTSEKNTSRIHSKPQQSSSKPNRNKISRYFKPPSAAKTPEIDPAANEIIQKPKTIKSTFNLNISNLSDSDAFEITKPVAVKSFFQPKIKGTGRANLKRSKKKANNRKLSEETRKFLYNEGKDVNEDHLQLALALSKSLQEDDTYFPNTQEKIANVKSNLQQFQYKPSKTASQSETIDFFKTDSNKSRKIQLVRLGSALLRQTEEERKEKVEEKVKKILNSQKNLVENSSDFDTTFEINLGGVNLDAYYCHERLLFKKASYSQNTDLSYFYVENLVEPTTVKAGYLLYDWGRIIGRDKSPVRDNKCEIIATEKSLKMENKNLEVAEVVETSVRSISPDLFNESDSIHLKFDKSIYKNIGQLPNDSEIIVCESFEDDGEVLTQTLIKLSENDSLSSCSNRAVHGTNTSSSYHQTENNTGKIADEQENHSVQVLDLTQSSNDDDNEKMGQNDQSPPGVYDLTQSSTSTKDSTEAHCSATLENDMCESSDSFDLPEVFLSQRSKATNSQNLSQEKSQSTKTSEKRLEIFSKKLREIESSTQSKYTKLPVISTPKVFKRYHSMIGTSKDELDSTLVAFNSSNISKQVEPSTTFDESKKVFDKSLKKYNSFVETLQDEYESSMIQEVNQEILNLNDEADLSDSDDVIFIDDEEINYSCNKSIQINHLNSPVQTQKIEDSISINASPIAEVNDDINYEYDLESYTQKNPENRSFHSDSSNSSTATLLIENEGDFSDNLNLKSFQTNNLENNISKRSESCSPKSNTSISSVATVLLEKEEHIPKNRNSHLVNNDNLDDTFERNLNIDYNPFDFTQKQNSEEPKQEIQPETVPTSTLSDSMNEQLDSSVLNKIENLVLPDKKDDNQKVIATPNREVILKFHDVTPMPHYDNFDTPKINVELKKFGLKPLRKKRGIQILRHIYEETHPLKSKTVKSPRTENSELENSSKRRKIDSEVVNCTKSFRTEERGLNYEIVEELRSAKDSDDDLIFERKFSTKLHSCRLPFHIAWHNFVSSNPEIRRQIVKYQPLQLEPIYAHFRSIGLKFHIDDILKFLDRRCITVRTNQNAHRNNRL